MSGEIEVVQLKVTTIEENGKVRVKVRPAGLIQRMASAVSSRGGLLGFIFGGHQACPAKDSEKALVREADNTDKPAPEALDADHSSTA